MKKVTIAAATAASLLASVAIAQQVSPSAAPATPTAQAPATATPGSNVTFIGMQTADQWLASDLIGMNVRGPSNESLGEINDVVLARDGRVVGAVIGVGGFLGVGEKDVAVPFQQVEMVRGSDAGDHVVLRKTKDELKAAPTFQEYEPPKANSAAKSPAEKTPAAPAATR